MYDEEGIEVDHLDFDYQVDDVVSEYFTPYEGTIVAVLKEAIETLKKPNDSVKYQKALEWIRAEERSKDYVTFGDICDIFETEPNSLRRKLADRLGNSDLIRE